ncbi:MAG: cob(I)yrinic acid a,c-diamide adenosyltransferase [Firmicutes bacterium]|nr:cob(I)yrinic acid a,c-diamide adenosyltransferase [Bacillota bacterium]MCM1477168.1 cob(I)yrinic acid a,c-diamide adenosyltransferase [Bacteroides sp.]
MTKAKVYTRTGDSGSTALVGGSRVAKHSARIEAYGTLDELNSHLGLITAHPHCTEHNRKYLTAVQSHLFDIGSYLASPPDNPYSLPTGVTPERLAAMEREIDHLDSELPPINNFVLPAGTQLAATCHVARTVCRRAERRITALAADTPVDPSVTAYVNRLSDYLFTLARHCNINARHDEIFWQKDC